MNRFANRGSLRVRRPPSPSMGSHTTGIVRLDNIFTDEIELAAGYKIAEELFAEAEADEKDES